MQQSPGELIRTFYSRVRGKAITCRFRLKCGADHLVPNRDTFVDYTNEIIRQVLIAGLYDEDVKRDVFGITNVDQMVLNDLVKFIEGKEVAREATCSSNVSAISQFKRKKQSVRSGERTQVKCATCSRLFPAFKKMANGKWNKKPFRECQECWKKGRSSGAQSVQGISQDDGESVSFNISLINEHFVDAAGDSGINACISAPSGE